MTTDAPEPAPTTAPAASVKVPFPLQQNERVLRLCRRHAIFLWPATIFVLLLAVVPIVVVAFVVTRVTDLSGNTARVFWIAALIWLVIMGIRGFLQWYRYHNDIWVITNQRIVDYTAKNPLSHRLSTTDLINVQDMTVERNGIFAAIFKYGDVICQTAADQQEFIMSGIPHAEEVQLLVDKERDRERMRRP
jgi:uncharacterized membrane protein YdbT with pleckstrin-like domain